MHNAMKASFPALKEWMPWAQSLASVRDTEIYLAHGERLWRSAVADGVEQPLQIMDPTDQIYYGATGIKPANLTIPSYEVGYWVNQPYAGQGFITEAMNALTRFLFEALKAKRVEINCEIGNDKSANVPIRLNYDFEGTLKNQRLDATSKKVSHSLIYSCTDIKQLPPLDYRWEV
jgi:RimJ/RimL family protein N-acetyltransferase